MKTTAIPGFLAAAAFAIQVELARAQVSTVPGGLRGLEDTDFAWADLSIPMASMSIGLSFLGVEGKPGVSSKTEKSKAKKSSKAAKVSGFSKTRF